jgi:hypothetical protein
MSHSGPFNPLDKLNLGSSVAEAILKTDIAPLPPAPFNGAGIYVIYYVGSFKPYVRIAKENKGEKFGWPIYVGKAIPKGARKGGATFDPGSVGPVTTNRLEEHAQSIQSAENLEISDFFCRYLVVDDIWIPLGESLLIQRFRPIWNTCIDGFGNHDPGSGRYQQKRSPWDVLHPGRPWAGRCAPSEKNEVDILRSLSDAIDLYFQSRPTS